MNIIPGCSEMRNLWVLTLKPGMIWTKNCTLNSSHVPSPLTLTAPPISNYWSDPIWTPFWPVPKKPSIPSNYNMWLALTCPDQLSKKMAVLHHKGGPSDSFHENRKPILCLHCGYTGHCASNCPSTQSNCPECPITCEWKQDKLISKSNKLICIMFNVCGSCSDTIVNHRNHICSLCGDGGHPACRCPRN